MNGTILAAIDDSTAASPVLTMAKAMATLLHLPLDVVHVQESDKQTAERVASAFGVSVRVVRGDPIGVVLAECRSDDVAMVVLGTRQSAAGPRPAGHTAIAVLQRVDKPAIVVPPDWPAVFAHQAIRRALVPFEGTPETSAAVADTIQMLADADVQLIGLHVFDRSELPSFWGRAGYAEESWACEFACRWCRERGVELHLRRGPVADAICAVAQTESIDLIVLGWGQVLDAGHPAIVRDVLQHGRVPLLLVPVGPRRPPTRSTVPLWHEIPI